MTALPPRIVHLAGGLSAVDLRGDHVLVQIDRNTEFCRFPTPDYQKLYGSLEKLGLTTIGVEFLQGGKFSDWNFFNLSDGFLCLFEGREWSKIRHSGIKDGDAAVAEIASKISCYIELANLRIQELSAAYRLNLWGSWDGNLRKGHLFGNMYTRRIDGAIHSAVADLASLRDALSEFVWRWLLKNDQTVTRYSAFRSKLKVNKNRIADEWFECGADGQWLKIFSDLRNRIIHVAPIGHQGAFHNWEMREIAVSKDICVPALHFPILTKDGTVWQPEKSEAEFLSAGDDEAIRAQLGAYREHVANSWDALTYLHGIVHNMVRFAREVRLASGLKGELVHLTDDDIIGEIKIS